MELGPASYVVRVLLKLKLHFLSFGFRGAGVVQVYCSNLSLDLD